MTTKQKQGILNALKTGGNVTIKPTRVQCGGILGSLLALMGIPLVADLISKVLGKGAPRLGTPHPFFGTWDQITGRGKKQNLTKGIYWEKTVPSTQFRQ